MNEGGKNMEKANGKYQVYYKSPFQNIDRKHRMIQSKISMFEGVCENFSTHLSAFSNDKGELLLIDYEDIIQLKPIKE